MVDGSIALKISLTKTTFVIRFKNELPANISTRIGEAFVQRYDRPRSAMTDQEALDELLVQNKTQPRSNMSSMEVLDQQDDDYLLLPDAMKDRWLSFIASLQANGVDPYNHAIVQIVKNIWGNTSKTIQNLSANRDEQVSRLTQLSISGITVSDIATARTL